MSAGFKDHFSDHAADYAVYRPGYPEALYDWLAEAAPARRLAWDCATGSGQAAIELARRFERVFASDASASQLDRAPPAANIAYRVEPAECTQLADRSVDLVTVAQAYHWLDHAAFTAVCARVCRPGAVLAIWTYALTRVGAGVDAIVSDLYSGVLGPYWPPERRLVERGYRGLTFPWCDLQVPAFSMRQSWTLAQFEGYLRTWSAVRRYMHTEGQDPVTALHGRLEAAWGADSEQPMQVEWPISVRAFRIP